MVHTYTSILVIDLSSVIIRTKFVMLKRRTSLLAYKPVVYERKTGSDDITWAFILTQLQRRTGLQTFIFRWPCISLQFLANDQLDALFYIFICYTSLHVSSIKCSSSGDRILLIRHVVWLVCVSDCLVCRSESNVLLVPESRLIARYCSSCPPHYTDWAIPLVLSCRMYFDVTVHHKIFGLCQTLEWLII